MSKKILITIFLQWSFLIFHCIAEQLTSVGSVPLPISDIKWVYLQFTSDVKYADMGTNDIQLEMTNVSSILRVKSNKDLFNKTSITIITLDGEVHTFDLHYQQDPPHLAYQVKEQTLEEIAAYNIELSDKQTSHILFQQKVVDIQTGSDKIIADYAEAIDNIIKCKSVCSSFAPFNETSLCVITEDKTIYPILVRYKEYPEIVNLQISSTSRRTEAIFSSHSINEPEMQILGRKIINKGCDLRNYGSIDNKMTFSLYGIYVKEDVMMFFLHIENLSKVDYEIDFIKSYIINKKTTKKSSYQADEKAPIFTYSEPVSQLIKASEGYSTVFFFKRFTIPNKHNLYFELFEKNGGRHLKFTIPNKSLLQAKQVEK